ncbi:MAG: hypothetical protein K2W95_15400 [Candidatus Obscuribacterales bacterium]|nr:hypothetical protein [Candidatus Obscuribacterales bacterium]
MSTILVCLLATAISGGGGYWISRKFWGSGHAATNTQGDFGGARGSAFATLGGALLGMALFGVLGKYIFPADTIGPGLITSMITGFIGGLTGAILAIKSKFDANKKNNDGDK